MGRSRATAGFGYRGPIPPESIDLLRHIWRIGHLAIESNHARSNRVPVAFAASMGWITTIHPDGKSFDRAWHVTAEGLFAIKEN